MVQMAGGGGGDVTACSGGALQYSPDHSQDCGQHNVPVEPGQWDIQGTVSLRVHTQVLLSVQRKECVAPSYTTNTANTLVLLITLASPSLCVASVGREAVIHFPGPNNNGFYLCIFIHLTINRDAPDNFYRILDIRSISNSK